MQWIRGNVFIPDARMFWIKPSIRRLKRLLAEHPVDAMISTGPPHSTHLIALGLKRAFPGLPWIADFRDPWSDMDYLDDFQLTPRSRTRHKQMEQAVVTQADTVVVTAPSAAKSLTGKSLEAGGDHVVWVPNGYDDADGFNLAEAPEDGPFVLGFFGSRTEVNAPVFLRRSANTMPKGPTYGNCAFSFTAPTPHSRTWSGTFQEDWAFAGSVSHDEVPGAGAVSCALDLAKQQRHRKTHHSRQGLRTPATGRPCGRR